MINRAEGGGSMRRVTQTIVAQGYRLIDEAPFACRLTFLHDAAADRPFILALSHTLRYAGWQPDDAVPPVYRLPGSNLIIEIEPGGADTSGHYLHLMETKD